MENNVTAVCQECNTQFVYDLKPGFPRKYCVTCSVIKKASYEAKYPEMKVVDGLVTVPVVKPGQMPTQAVNKIKIADPTQSMYVSYAKDLMVAGFELHAAIDAIKTAREQL